MLITISFKNVSLSYGILRDSVPTQKQVKFEKDIIKSISEYSDVLDAIVRIERSRDTALREGRLRRAQLRARDIKQTLKQIGLSDAGIRSRLTKYRIDQRAHLMKR